MRAPCATLWRIYSKKVGLDTADLAFKETHQPLGRGVGRDEKEPEEVFNVNFCCDGSAPHPSQVRR